MTKRAWGVGLLVVLTAVALMVLVRVRADRALATHFESAQADAAKHIELVGHLPTVLDETSGIAVSRAHPGVYWSHNDSGDRPNLYAIDPSGRLLATFRVEGAEARDWEDISLGPCIGEGPAQTPPYCIYLADIGDNNGVRDFLTVYVVREPAVPPRSGEPAVLTSRSFRYRYPKGADDAEALAVLPDGDVTIVSKGRSGSIDFFRLRREAIAVAADSDEVLIAEYIGDSGIPPDGGIGRHATGAAVSPDGSTLAVRTYYEVYSFAAANDAGSVSWRSPGKRCSLGNLEPQGEAVDYLDAETLVITSERSDRDAGSIHRVRC